MEKGSISARIAMVLTYGLASIGIYYVLNYPFNWYVFAATLFVIVISAKIGDKW
ncbi:hypothetical protein [Aridibaculum aurantiacum]|uniref:hypothetical protein n=1 Tax=Aridibaculum aurantiacum TaxID=2810307 RepID=UPI001A961453|nr:hypothetical protein [Aridibaculum aurantiacum]